MLKAWLRPFYSDDDGAPQGGDTGDKPKPTDILDRFGRDALKLAEKLSEALTDNFNLREKNRALRTERDTLKQRETPDGATVLTAEDAARWQAYVALGAPDALKTQLETAQTASQEAAQLKREKTIGEAATAHGFKASVLTRLAGDLEIAIKPDGKDHAPIAYVVRDGKETKLDAYAEQEWRDFLPALRATVKTDAPDINASGRGGSNGITLTDDERQRIARRYQSTF